MLKTTSQLLSHHQAIEEKQAETYIVLAERHPKYTDLFTGFAKENLRHRDIAQRAYREGVTDAFEVGFIVDPLNPVDYSLIAPEGDLSEIVEAMIKNEETVIRFCLDIALNSSNLLPDVPETFKRLVKRKKRNLEKLKEIA